MSTSLNDLRLELEDLIGPELARQWMISPNSELEGMSPMDAFVLGKAEAVKWLVHDIRSGQPG